VQPAVSARSAALVEEDDTEGPQLGDYLLPTDLLLPRNIAEELYKKYHAEKRCRRRLQLSLEAAEGSIAALTAQLEEERKTAALRIDALSQQVFGGGLGALDAALEENKLLAARLSEVLLVAPRELVEQKVGALVAFAEGEGSTMPTMQEQLKRLTQRVGHYESVFQTQAARILTLEGALKAEMERSDELHLRCLATRKVAFQHLSGQLPL
jgi:hypothetical protein